MADVLADRLILDDATQAVNILGDGVIGIDSAANQIDIGDAAGRTLSIFQNAAGGRGGIQFYPDGFTQTVSPAQTFIDWSSTIESSIPGGGGLGNDSFGSFIGVTGTFNLNDPGNLFNSGLLFNFAMTHNLRANSGPLYTLVNQPLIRADGAARTISQQNAVRAQTRYGPNINGGTLVAASYQPFFAFMQVDATGGACSVTAVDYFAANAPTLTGGGTIGTLNVMNIPDIPAAGITTIRGINSAMNNGFFIFHTGTATSFHGGEFRMADNTPIRFGGVPGNGVQLSRPSAGILRIIGNGGTNNEGLDFNMDAGANHVSVSSSTGAGLGLNLVEIVFGTTAPSGTNNWQALFAPGAKTTTLAGDFSRRLFSAAGAVTINAALSNFFTDTVNEPFGTIGSGSVVNAGNMLIQTSPSIGTNRYGLLITANPTGGTLNYAFRQSNASARARFDGLLDINRPIALGGGAGATLGTIGGSGPTAAAQSKWIQIQVAGVNHWIPAWV